MDLIILMILGESKNYEICCIIQLFPSFSVFSYTVPTALRTYSQTRPTFVLPILNEATMLILQKIYMSVHALLGRISHNLFFHLDKI
jgi:uncharacterized membrane protein (GlpM family)